MDITAIGSKITVMSAALPAGKTFTNAPDSDSFFTIDAVDIAQVEVGLNCHKISWALPNKLRITVSLIPNSEDDKDMQKMFWYDRPQGMAANIDSVQISIAETGKDTPEIYGDFTLVSGSPANTAESNGRFSNKQYVFEGVTRVF